MEMAAERIWRENERWWRRIAVEMDLESQLYYRSFGRIRSVVEGINGVMVRKIVLGFSVMAAMVDEDDGGLGSHRRCRAFVRIGSSVYTLPKSASPAAMAAGH
ncbi:hypothetical protein ACLOJK_024221 [Asimina triloba]